MSFSISVGPFRQSTRAFSKASASEHIVGIVAGDERGRRAGPRQRRRTGKTGYVGHACGALRVEVAQPRRRDVCPATAVRGPRAMQDAQTPPAPKWPVRHPLLQMSDSLPGFFPAARLRIFLRRCVGGFFGGPFSARPSPVAKTPSPGARPYRAGDPGMVVGVADGERPTHLGNTPGRVDVAPAEHGIAGRGGCGRGSKPSRPPSSARPIDRAQK